MTLKPVVFAAMVGLLFLAAGSPISPASAQQKPSPGAGFVKMGVLNEAAVFRDALMTKDIAKQIDAKRRKFREEILKEEENLRKTGKELEGKRVLMTSEAVALEARKFRAMEAALQQKVQKRNREFNEFRNPANKAFEGALNRAVLVFAKQHGFTLILRQRQVFLRAKTLDVTKAVMAILDKNVPSYKVPDRTRKPGKK